MSDKQDDLTLVYMYGFKNGQESMKAENERLRAAENCSVPDYDPAIGIVARLRQLGQWRVDGTKSSPIYNNSADRIEALEAALREIIENEDQYSMGWAAKIARAALEGEKTND